MFKSTSAGLVALTFLSGDAKAAKTKYRPPAGATPWYKEATHSTWEKPDWDVNYFVPNFGQDREIMASLSNTHQAEKNLGHKLQATFKPPKGHPVDYFVPNFGKDEDIKLTHDNLQQSEQDLGHTWTPDLSKKKPLPKNYFVPNFGVDRDVKDTHASLSTAENSTGHKWDWKPKTKAEKAGHPTDYFVPNFGLDKDVVDTQAHIAAQEAKHGKWTPTQDDNGVWIVPGAADNKSYTYKSLVQLEADAESDPICSSAGCGYASEKGAKTHPMNYFVPNFGRDADLNHTDNSLDWAERNLKHKWNWVKPTKKEDAKDYFVPDFGLEEDIKQTHEAIAAQEKIHGKWVPVQDENGVWEVPEAANNKSYTYNANVQLDSVAKGDGPICMKSDLTCGEGQLIEGKKYLHDYFVPDFGVDKDIKDSQAHVKQVEAKLNHVWTPVQDENGVWGVPEAANNKSYTYRANVQLPTNLASSDPICSSAGCPEKKDPAGHPKDYFVPDFGMDKDVIDTQAHIKQQEAAKGHTWTPKQDENGNWEVPEAAHNGSYSYNSLVQLDREPLLGWEPKMAHSHPMNYFVPNFGKDHDNVLTTENSLRVAQYTTGHYWDYKPKTAAEKAGHPVDYPVANFGVDEDIKNTQAAIAAQEAKHGKWNVAQDDNGVWIVPTAANNKSYTYKK